MFTDGVSSSCRPRKRTVSLRNWRVLAGTAPLARFYPQKALQRSFRPQTGASSGSATRSAALRAPFRRSSRKRNFVRTGSTAAQTTSRCLRPPTTLCARARADLKSCVDSPSCRVRGHVRPHPMLSRDLRTPSSLSTGRTRPMRSRTASGQTEAGASSSSLASSTRSSQDIQGRYCLHRRRLRSCHDYLASRRRRGTLCRRSSKRPSLRRCSRTNWRTLSSATTSRRCRRGASSGRVYCRSLPTHSERSYFPSRCCVSEAPFGSLGLFTIVDADHHCSLR